MMREFLLNSEELLNKEAVAFMEREGQLRGLFSCYWIHFNERIKLAYFTDGFRTLAEIWPEKNLDEACRIAGRLLDRVMNLEESADDISLENVIWDPDSIYVNQEDEVFFICLPAVLPPDSAGSGIYKKRLYSLIEDLVSGKEGGIFLSRQINYQKNKAFGDWAALKNTLTLREPQDNEDSMIVLRSINASSEMQFSIGTDRFRIGSDPDVSDGVITGTDSVDSEHAVIGWNGINHFITDLGSTNGTFVNDQKITPNTEVPIGEGTVLRFGEFTFNVE